MVSQLCVVVVALREAAFPEDWVGECGFVEWEGWRGGEYGCGRMSGFLLSPGDKMKRRGC